ncbi:hypothetical protein ElyMa_005220900 [Elysia marginata]|uniref:LRRNT domain-containing protein n=1 Tax=Elysia marginata TaxID=1093978 RepID=A0AAV4K1A3_9GAST|nr:hypothetical protein ElyMa_005220900 [Elysia marginata]
MVLLVVVLVIVGVGGGDIRHPSLGTLCTCTMPKIWGTVSCLREETISTVDLFAKEAALDSPQTLPASTWSLFSAILALPDDAQD